MTALLLAEGGLLQDPSYVPHLLDLLLPYTSMLLEDPTPGPGTSTLRFANLTIQADACLADTAAVGGDFMNQSPRVGRLRSAAAVLLVVVCCTAWSSACTPPHIRPQSRLSSLLGSLRKLAWPMMVQQIASSSSLASPGACTQCFGSARCGCRVGLQRI